MAIQKWYIDQKLFMDYVKYVHSRLNDEMKRAKLLHPSTQTALMQVAYDRLIDKRLEIFDAEFRVRIEYFFISLNQDSDLSK